MNEQSSDETSGVRYCFLKTRLDPVCYFKHTKVDFGTLFRYFIWVASKNATGNSKFDCFLFVIFCLNVTVHRQIDPF